MTTGELMTIKNLQANGTPQQKLLLNHLMQDSGSITQYEALMLYRIAALPRRIADLKAHGISFVTERRKDETGRDYVRYFLRNAGGKE